MTKIESIQELYTDKITIVGIVRRIHYHLLAVLWDDVQLIRFKQWHYFGTTPAEKPPTSSDPIFQHDYVQIPNDVSFLASNGNDQLYQLGLEIGLVKEGLKPRE